MSIYSFRAECQADLDAFIEAGRAAGILLTVEAKPDPQFPDVDVQFTSDASLEELHALMATVEDGHVMLQTLRECPLAENSLKRKQA